MNRIKRISKKDKYGIVRTCSLVCALLAIFAALLLFVQQRRMELACANDVAAATQRSAAQFNQLIDDTRQLLDGVVADLDSGSLQEEQAVQTLSDYAQLDSASIQQADGVLTEIIRGADGVQLRKPLRSGRELVVTLSEDTLHAILSGALEGDYIYTLYNTNTGAFLFGNGGTTTDNYYDVLLNMAQDGKVQEISASTEAVHAKMPDGAYYVALSEDAENACGVSFIVPDALLHKRHSLTPGDIVAVLLPVLLLIGVILLSSRSSLRRIRNSNQNIASALEMSDQMVSIAARDARITILVIGYGHEGVLSCHDGLGLTNSSTFIRSISDLERVCGMADGEMDRVYECMNRLPGEKTAALTVHCYTASHEDRSLRISFRAAADGGRNILCSISDCTHELAAQYRMEQEHSYLNNAMRRASSIWQINVSRNRWHAVHIDRNDPLAERVPSPKDWRDYSADLGNLVNAYVHPADSYDFAERTNVPGLASAFRSGATEFSMDYRVSAAKPDTYEWHRMHVHLLADPKTNDILANFYLYNVDAKKNAELERGERKRVLQRTLTAMSGIYSGLYYVDLDNDLCYTARSRDGELTDQLCMPYKLTFDRYIDASVHPEDREELRKTLSAYLLKREMSEGSHFRQCFYRYTLGDGSYRKMSIMVQPARFENGAIKEVALAIRVLDRETE